MVGAGLALWASIEANQRASRQRFHRRMSPTRCFRQAIFIQSKVKLGHGTPFSKNKRAYRLQSEDLDFIKAGKASKHFTHCPGKDDQYGGNLG